MKFEWRGFIAAILAFGLSLTLILGVAGGVWSGRSLGERGGEVMVATLVAMVAAISTYFATKNHDK
jgi:hypothetical protein